MIGFMRKPMIAVILTLMLVLLPCSGTIENDRKELLDLSPEFSDTTPIGWFDKCSASGMDVDKCRSLQLIGENHNHILQSVVDDIQPSHNPFAAESFEDALSIWLNIYPSLESENDVAFEVLKIWYEMGYSQNNPEYIGKDLMRLAIEWVNASGNTEALDTFSELEGLLPNLWMAIHSEKNSSVNDLDMASELDAAINDSTFSNTSSVTQDFIWSWHAIYSYSFAFFSSNTTAVLIDDQQDDSQSDQTSARGCPGCWVATADLGGGVIGAAVGFFGGFGFGAIPGAQGDQLRSTATTVLWMSTAPNDFNLQPEGKYNVYAQNFDNMHDNLFDELIDNLVCRQDGSVWQQKILTLLSSAWKLPYLTW